MDMAGQKTLQFFFKRKETTPTPGNAPQDVKSKIVGSEAQVQKPCHKKRKTEDDEQKFDHEKHIGKRIRVWWSTEKEFFTGKVVAVQTSGPKVRVDYEDGDVEWVNLLKRRHNFVSEDELVEEDSPLKDSSSRSRAAKRNCAKAVLEEDDGEVSEQDVGDDDSDYSLGDSPEASSSSEPSSDSLDGEDDLEDQEISLKERDGKIRKKLQKGDGVSISDKSKSTSANGAGPFQKRSRPSVSLNRTITERSRSPDAYRTILKEKLESSQHLGKGDAKDGYTARELDRFPFLQPNKLKDANGTKKGDPQYDPSTLYIPERWFKDFKISPGQRQWWEFKAQNFDAVLLFKMGKFYEMFEMDAHIGVEHLGLIYMRGEQPHCGFPEKAYAINAERLARKGYRVVVIEQTETPEQLAERNAERRRQGKKLANVVRRDKVAVLSPGTLFDAEMVRNSHQSSYIVALAEGRSHKDILQFGICAVDVTTGRMLIGTLIDNSTSSKLQTFLTAIKPVELIIPKCTDEESNIFIHSQTCDMLKKNLISAKFNELIPGTQFWNAKKALEEIVPYFNDEEAIPTILKEMKGKFEENVMSLKALGGMLSFLRRALLDEAIIPVCQFHKLPEDGIPSFVDEDESSALLDASALANLEIVENGEGDIEGTLLSQLDQCASGPGHRLLRHWLLHPLKNVKAICERQQAVKELIHSSSAENIHAGLRRLPDLERCLTRMAASARGTGREASNVILYEDASRKRLRAFIATLKGFRSLGTLFADLQKDIPSPSTLLHEVVSLGNTLPTLQNTLDTFETAFNWEEAGKQGRIIPNKGVDSKYDAAEECVSNTVLELEQYLEEQKAIFGSKNRIKYIHINGSRYQIEVPESLKAKIPQHYELTSQKKANGGQQAVTRYTTDTIKETVARLTLLEENLEKALSDIVKNLIGRFCEHASMWQSAVDASAKLDCLAAMSLHAGSSSTMCQPIFVDSETPIFSSKALSHPAGISTGDSSFVTNDICLGGDHAPFMLLTGPNMGGKSTLIRQVCLATILAQVGAHVPAESLSLTPVDAVFVRMGARDSIITGQSTFHVELSETAAILDLATPKSLVALDEFGRGTATCDGVALAAAVMDHLVQKTNCLTIFATHYHWLGELHRNAKNVLTCHMACKVDDGLPNGIAADRNIIPEVTFLYKLSKGICPKSYGVSVAKLAGIPSSILEKAVNIQIDNQSNN